MTAHSLLLKPLAARVFTAPIEVLESNGSPRQFPRMDTPAWTCLSGCGTVSLLLGGVTTAAVAYRGRHGASFSYLDGFLSDLGEIGVSRYAAVFNASLMLAGLALAVFMHGLGRHLNNGRGRVAARIGVGSGLSLALVGVVPSNVEIHRHVAFLYFTSVLTAITCFSLAILGDRDARLSRWLLVPAATTLTAFAWFIAGPQLLPAPELATCVATLAWILLTAVNVGWHGRRADTDAN